jgi:hypothetical protein
MQFFYRAREWCGYPLIPILPSYGFPVTVALPAPASRFCRYDHAWPDTTGLQHLLRPLRLPVRPACRYRGSWEDPPPGRARSPSHRLPPHERRTSPSFIRPGSCRAPGGRPDRAPGSRLPSLCASATPASLPPVRTVHDIRKTAGFLMHPAAVLRQGYEKKVVYAW